MVAELKRLRGAHVQKVWQSEPLAIVFSLYYGSERLLMLTADPDFARCHLISRKPANPATPPQFCQILRKHLAGAKLEVVRQRGLDRVIELGFSGEEGDFMLVGEFMGKHSNLMLVSSDRKILGAAKWVSSTMSKRPVSPGKPYEPPPFAPRPTILSAKEGDDLSKFEGVSPFLVKLIESGVPLADLQTAIRESGYLPVHTEDAGAYAWTLQSLGKTEYRTVSISQALDRAYSDRVQIERTEAARRNLLGRLQSVLNSRRRSITELDEAIEGAQQAPKIQQLGELILAYQGQIKPGDSAVEVWDYEGNPITIKLKPDMTVSKNADLYFNKAKKAKAGQEHFHRQRERMLADVLALEQAVEELLLCISIAQVDEIADRAKAKRWMVEQRLPTAKEERPHEGHAVKELTSPSGYKVLFGTNATSNDYVTTRVAKSNDWWFHVRGQTSAHVILQSGNSPDRVPYPDLVFAAEIAHRNSVAKHSQYVPVDYTLKKYVRKPRGSAAGFVTYTHEKTIHIDG